MINTTMWSYNGTFDDFYVCDCGFKKPIFGDTYQSFLYCPMCGKRVIYPHQVSATKSTINNKIFGIISDIWSQETKCDTDLTDFDLYISAITAYGYSELAVREFAKTFNIEITEDIYDIDDEAFMDDEQIIKGALHLDEPTLSYLSAIFATDTNK